MTPPSLNEAWLSLGASILAVGRKVAPRGQGTREIPQRTFAVDMRRPVLTIPERKLSYQFMAAEAFWILSGDDLVENIAPYNKHIADFSDDGVKFFGAYGPKIINQLSYVVGKLIEDPDTRQAGLTIWRENPPNTKDVPCTVAIFFSLREGKLNCHVFMRSSDAWLGVPYDVFNFSMLSHFVSSLLNDQGLGTLIEPGTLYLTAASSHVYDRNAEAFDAIIQSAKIGAREAKTPLSLYTVPSSVLPKLKEIRSSSPGHPSRWWEHRS